jgi:hypothetical protein
MSTYQHTAVFAMTAINIRTPSRKDLAKISRVNSQATTDAPGDGIATEKLAGGIESRHKAENEREISVTLMCISKSLKIQQRQAKNHGVSSPVFPKPISSPTKPARLSKHFILLVIVTLGLQ